MLHPYLRGPGSGFGACCDSCARDGMGLVATMNVMPTETFVKTITPITAPTVVKTAATAVASGATLSPTTQLVVRAAQTVINTGITQQLPVAAQPVAAALIKPPTVALPISSAPVLIKQAPAPAPSDGVPIVRIPAGGFVNTGIVAPKPPATIVKTPVTASAPPTTIVRTPVAAPVAAPVVAPVVKTAEAASSPVKKALLIGVPAALLLWAIF